MHTHLTMGEKIEDLIKSKKSTQAKEAKDMGVAASMLSDIINGNRKEVRSDTLEKLCRHFNVSADWLLGLSDIPSRNETLQSVGAYTGLWQQALITLRVEQDTGGRDIQDFISYLISHPALPALIDALQQKNSFANTGEKFSLDVGKSRNVYSVEIEAVCKKIVDDLLREILDGYAVKHGEELIDHVTG